MQPGKRILLLNKVREGELKDGMKNVVNGIGQAMYLAPGADEIDTAQALGGLLTVNGESMAQNPATVAALGDGLQSWGDDQMRGDDPDPLAISNSIYGLLELTDKNGDPVVPIGSSAYRRIQAVAGGFTSSGSGAMTQLNDRRKEELRQASKNDIIPFLVARKNGPNEKGEYTWEDANGTKHAMTEETFMEHLSATYELNGNLLRDEYRKLADSQRWSIEGTNQLVTFADLTTQMMDATTSEERDDILAQLTPGSDTYNQELLVSLGTSGLERVRQLRDTAEDTAARRQDPEFTTWRTNMSMEYFGRLGVDIGPWAREAMAQGGAAATQDINTLIRVHGRGNEQGYAVAYARVARRMKTQWDNWVIANRELSDDGWANARDAQLETMTKSFQKEIDKLVDQYGKEVTPQ